MSARNRRRDIALILLGFALRDVGRCVVDLVLGRSQPSTIPPPKKPKPTHAEYLFLGWPEKAGDVVILGDVHEA